MPPSAIIHLTLKRRLPLPNPPHQSHQHQWQTANRTSVPLPPITWTSCPLSHFLHHPFLPQATIARTGMGRNVTNYQPAMPPTSIHNHHNNRLSHNRHNKHRHSYQPPPIESATHRRLAKDTLSCIAAQIFMSVPPIVAVNALIHCAAAPATQHYSQQSLPNRRNG